MWAVLVLSALLIVFSAADPPPGTKWKRADAMWDDFDHGWNSSKVRRSLSVNDRDHITVGKAKGEGRSGDRAVCVCVCVEEARGRISSFPLILDTASRLNKHLNQPAAKYSGTDRRATGKGAKKEIIEGRDEIRFYSINFGLRKYYRESGLRNTNQDFGL
jgi:hypothetical protein